MCVGIKNLFVLERGSTESIGINEWKRSAMTDGTAGRSNNATINHNAHQRHTGRRVFGDGGNGTVFFFMLHGQCYEERRRSLF